MYQLLLNPVTVPILLCAIIFLLVIIIIVLNSLEERIRSLNITVQNVLDRVSNRWQ